MAEEEEVKPAEQEPAKDKHVHVSERADPSNPHSPLVHKSNPEFVKPAEKK
jgi:hypothetical protein